MYQLPTPIKEEREEDIGTAIKELNAKLAESVRKSQANDIEIVNSLNVDDQVLQTHALLKLHVTRWKVARKEWSRLQKNSSSRYKESRDILKSIFEELE